MTKVIYYTTVYGNSLVKEFIDHLSEREQRKITRVLSNVEKYGLTTAIPHIKKLTGTPLWEIRILGKDSIRIIYATLDRDLIIVLHGFIKKSQKTPYKELEIALNRLNEWNSNLEGA